MSYKPGNTNHGEDIMRLFKVFTVVLLASLFFSMPSEAGFIKKIKNKVTGQDDKKDKKKKEEKKEVAKETKKEDKKNTATEAKKEEVKVTPPNEALIEQLSALKNPEGIDNNAKPQALKETPAGSAVEESKILIDLRHQLLILE